MPRLEERRTPVTDVVVDQPDALSDVLEIPPLALAAHNATASRLIRSATRPFPRELLDIDLAAERILKIEDQGAQIEDIATRIELDEEVDVASGHRVTPGHRPEGPDVASAMAPRDSLDLRASPA